MVAVVVGSGVAGYVDGADVTLPVGVHGEERVPRERGIDVGNGVGAFERRVGGS